MAMQTMNGAQEIDAIINAPPETNLKRDAEGHFITPSADNKPAKVTKEAIVEEDESPEWVSRLKISKDQHDGVTEVIKRAINKKHAQAKDAEEFAAEQYNEKMLAERRAESLERELAQFKNVPAEKAPETVQKPTRALFTDDEAYIEALADWKTEQKFFEREQKAIKEREEATQRVIVTAAHARIAAARLLVSDFDEVVGGADINVPAHIASYMQESDLFAELGYHFAKHADELQKLSDMPVTNPVQAARLGVALSKIESNIKPFASKAKSNPAPTSDDDDDGDLPSNTGTIPSLKPRAAAPVIQVLNSSCDSQVEKRDSNMSYDEAKAKWANKNRRNFEVRKRH